MQKPFLGILVHPWDLCDEGVAGVAENLAGLGISSAFVAVNSTAEEHPPQPIDARLTHNPKRKRYVSEEGRFYHQIDPSFYVNSVVVPKRSSDHDLMGFDALRESTDVFPSNGINTYAWLTSLHNGQFVSEAHELATIDITGNPDRNWICPNNPNAAIMLLEIVNELQNRYDLRGILLDHFWWKYPHTHMAALEPGIVCFCEHCRQRMDSSGIDARVLVRTLAQIPKVARTLSQSKIDQIRHAETEGLLNTVGLQPEQGAGYADVMNALFEDEHIREKLPELAEQDSLGIFRWLRDNPIFFEWLEFKADGLRELLEAVRELAKSNDPKFQIGLAIWSPRSAWTVCQSYRKLSRICDWMMPMAYHRLWGWYSACVAEEIFQIVHPKTPLTFASYKAILASWFKLAGYTARPLRTLIANGLPPEQIRKELLRARSLVGPDTALYAGLQFWEPASKIPHPEESAQSTRICFESKMDGMIMQAYGWAPIPNLMAAAEAVEEFSRTRPSPAV